MIITLLMRLVLLLLLPLLPQITQVLMRDPVVLMFLPLLLAEPRGTESIHLLALPRETVIRVRRHQLGTTGGCRPLLDHLLSRHTLRNNKEGRMSETIAGMDLLEGTRREFLPPFSIPPTLFVDPSFA